MKKYISPKIKHSSYKIDEEIANIAINSSKFTDDYFGEEQED